MMKRFPKLIIISLVVMAAALTLTLSVSGRAYAASQQTCDDQRHQLFLGIFPTWYEYLPYTYNAHTNECDVKINTQVCYDSNGTVADCSSKSAVSSAIAGSYWLIGLGVIDILVRVAGFLAVIMLIVGGVRYITSSGEPEATKAALNTLINALIGIVIVIIAVPTVRFVGDQLENAAGVNKLVNGVPTVGTGAFNIQYVFNIAYAVIGAIGVLMIVIAGFRYIISGGDPQAMSKAKNAIIYTAVGLVIIMAATAIINFVISYFHL